MADDNNSFTIGDKVQLKNQSNTSPALTVISVGAMIEVTWYDEPSRIFLRDRFDAGALEKT